jgi:hypothetical protein
MEFAMPRKQVRPQSCGYVITEAGRYDLHLGETCQCNPRLAGLLVECAKCGTVYGSLRDRLNDTAAYRGKPD